MADISNRDDVIDFRDVIARIEELEGEREALADALNEATEALAEATDETREALEETAEEAQSAIDDWDNDNADELKALKALAEEAEGYAADWRHGAALIRDSYFEDHARELADDLHGRGVRDASWPFDCIDWEKAANNLKADYTSVDFDGVEYWVRCS